MKLSRRRLLGVLGLGLFAGGTVAKVVAEEKKFDYSEVYCSKEAMEDIMNWNVDQVDEQTKREILSYNG